MNFDDIGHVEGDLCVVEDRVFPLIEDDTADDAADDEEEGGDDNCRHDSRTGKVITTNQLGGPKKAEHAVSTPIPDDGPGESLDSSSACLAAVSLLLPVRPLTVLVTGLRVTALHSPSLSTDSVVPGLSQDLPSQSLSSSSTAQTAGTFLPGTELTI